MKPGSLGNEQHPSLGTLALLAGRDLKWRRRYRLARHLKECVPCESQWNAFLAARQDLRREAEAETLTSFEAIADWGRLEREMMGNIAVGVAAARCVDRVPRRRKLFVPALLACGLVATFVLAWSTHIPTEQTRRIFYSVQSWWKNDGQSAGIVLRSTPLGLAVHWQGTTLILHHPRSAVVSLSGGSSVEARFVDESTGQVTITSVYAQ